MSTTKHISFKTSSSKEALAWMKDNPQSRLFDEYGNYVVYINDHIEYYYMVDEWDFDHDKMDEEEFLQRFDDIGLSEI